MRKEKREKEIDGVNVLQPSQDISVGYNRRLIIVPFYRLFTRVEGTLVIE